MMSRPTTPLSVMETDGTESWGLFQRNWAPLRLDLIPTGQRSSIMTMRQSSDIVEEHGLSDLQTPRLSLNLVEQPEEPVLLVEVRLISVVIGSVQSS